MHMTQIRLTKPFLAMMLLTISLCFMACSEKEEDTKPVGTSSLQVTPGKLSFTSAGGTQQLQVKTTYKYFGYDISADWLSGDFKEDPTYNYITITAEPNTSTSARSAIIKVTGSNSTTITAETVSITIEQEGKTTDTSKEMTANIGANGGQVELNELKIEMPSGTFGEATEVKVAELTKGTILPNDEVSPFYEISMPVHTGGKFKVRIKSDQQSDDIVMVARTPGFSRERFESVNNDLFLEPIYKDGAYEVEFPKFVNPNDETKSFTVGLGRAKTLSTGARTRSNGGQVRNVKWHFVVPRSFEIEKGDVLDVINDYMGKSITKLIATGIVKSDTKTYDISVKFEDREVGDYGEFSGSLICHEFSSVYLNSKLFTGTIDHKELYQTVIHELHHYFSDEYDTRWLKSGCGACSQWIMLIEAGGVWAERLADSKETSTILQGNCKKFSQGYYFEDLYNGGVYDDECDPPSTWYDPTSWYVRSDRRGKGWQSHGYGMALFFEYVSQKWGDRAVTEFYQKMYDGGKDTYDCIEKAIEEKDRFLLAPYVTTYYEFLVDAALGKIRTGIAYSNMRDNTKKYSFNQDGEKTFTSDCYRFGISISTINIAKAYKNDKGSNPFVNKQLEVKESLEKVATDVYLIANGSKKGTYVSEFLGTVTQSGPLVIKDETTLNDLTENKTLLLISHTPENDKMHPSRLTAKLGDGENDNPMTRAKVWRVETKFRNDNLIGSYYSEYINHNELFGESVSWSGWDLQWSCENDAEGNLVIRSRQTKPSSEQAITTHPEYVLQDKYKLPGEYTNESTMEMVFAADKDNNVIILKSGWIKHRLKTNHHVSGGQTADKLIEMEFEIKDYITEKKISDWTNANMWGDDLKFVPTGKAFEKAVLRGTRFKKISGQETFERIEDTITDGWEMDLEVRFGRKSTSARKKQHK